MKVPEKENEPYPGKRTVPPGVFPDQVAADVQKNLNEHAENRESNSPEPAVRNAEDLVLFFFQ